MATQQIVWTVVAGALFLFWQVFAFAGTRKPNTGDAMVVMEYGRLLQFPALLTALTPPTLMGTMAWYPIWQRETQLAIFGSSLLGLSVLGGVLLVEVVRVRIVLTEEGITRYSPWAATVTLKWGDIKSVQWSTMNRWFVIHADSATIRVSRYLKGRQEFSETLRSKVVAERRVGAQQALTT